MHRPKKTIAKELDVDFRTVYNLYEYCWNIYSNHWCEMFSNVKLGEKSYDGSVNNCPVIEIDESLWGHLVDDERDIYQNQIWLLGIYDRGENFFKAIVIEGERTENNLIPLIVTNVSTLLNKKTIIFTDGFRAYSKLANYGYDHRVIIHDRWFGEGFNTTNTIESCWANLKHYTNKFFKGQNFKNITGFKRRLESKLYYINFVKCNESEKEHLLEMLGQEEESICNVIKNFNFVPEAD